MVIARVGDIEKIPGIPSRALDIFKDSITPLYFEVVAYKSRQPYVRDSLDSLQLSKDSNISRLARICGVMDPTSKERLTGRRTSSL